VANAKKARGKVATAKLKLRAAAKKSMAPKIKPAKPSAAKRPSSFSKMGGKANRETLAMQFARSAAKKGKKKFRLPLAKSETFSFPSQIPKSEPTLSSSESAVQGGQLDLPVIPVLRLAEKKRQVPHAATAILGSFLVTALLFALFLFLMRIGWLYTLSISIAIFVGFAILFYNYLEGKDAA